MRKHRGGRQTCIGGVTFQATTQNPFPSGLLPIAGNSNGMKTFLGQGITALRRDLKHPYLQRWNVSVQQALPFRMMFDIGYIGSRAVGLLYSQAVNPVPAQDLSTSPVRDQATINYLSQNVPNPFYGLPEFAGTSLATATVGRSQLLRPYPQFTSITQNARDGYSWYHALQARAEKRMSAGFTTTVSFTWSKSMDATTKLNESDPVPYRTISSFDRPLNITVSAVYELPFGRRRRWLAGSRWLDQAVGGWSIQALYIGQSGAPINFGNIIFTGRIEDIVLSPSSALESLKAARISRRVWSCCSLGNSFITFSSLWLRHRCTSCSRPNTSSMAVWSALAPAMMIRYLRSVGSPRSRSPVSSCMTAAAFSVAPLAIPEHACAPPHPHPQR